MQFFDINNLNISTLKNKCLEQHFQYQITEQNDMKQKPQINVNNFLIMQKDLVGK